MGNVADQLLVLLVESDLLFRVILEPHTHLFQALAQLPKLVVRFRFKLKIKIPILDILGRDLHLPERSHDSSVYP